MLLIFKKIFFVARCRARTSLGYFISHLNDMVDYHALTRAMHIITFFIDLLIFQYFKLLSSPKSI